MTDEQLAYLATHARRAWNLPPAMSDWDSVWSAITLGVEANNNLNRLREKFIRSKPRTHHPPEYS